jgi:hypothetical protein
MPAPIQATDSGLDRFSKLLPADVTAAFISTKSVLQAKFDSEHEHFPIIGFFLIILALSPLYFRWVTKIENQWHRYFLVATSAIFAFSLADKQFSSCLSVTLASVNVPTVWVNPSITALAAVLPILWTLIVSQIALSALSDRAIDQGPKL